MIEDYSWIKDELDKHFPDANLDQGVDLDGNGKLEESERIRDFNKNGYVGDREDWVVFFQNNTEKLRSLGGLFKWGEALKPDNPFHDLASIESQVYGPQRIQDAYKQVVSTVTDVGVCDPDYTDNPREKLGSVYDTMLLNGITFSTNPSDDLVTVTMRDNILDCLGSGAVALAVSHEMDWPVSLVPVPRHVFVRWEDEETRFNMDFGAIHADSYYQNGWALLPETIEEGVYLKSLDHRGYIAMLFENRGIYKAKKGNYPSALTDYDKSLSFDDKDPQVYYNRGIAHAKLGNYEKAIADFKQTTALNPRYAEAFLNSGSTKLKLGRNEDAIADFERALDLDYKNAEVYYSIGLAKRNLSIEKRRPSLEQEAIDAFTIAISKKPDFIEARFNRGLANGTLGHFEEALDDFNHILELKPDHQQARLFRGRALQMLGRQE